MELAKDLVCSCLKAKVLALSTRPVSADDLRQYHAIKMCPTFTTMVAPALEHRYAIAMLGTFADTTTLVLFLVAAVVSEALPN
jgi:hypothetical protein